MAQNKKHHESFKNKIMTINELMTTPICEISDCLSKLYKDPVGYYKKDYWFTDLHEVFGIEFPEGCGWRIIPCMSTYREDRNGKSALDKIKYDYYDTMNFGITKISKYGECLTYELEFYLNANSKFDKKSNKWIETVKVDLRNIKCNNNGYPSWVYIGGPDIVNNSEIGVHFQLSESGDYQNKWLDQYEFLDDYPSIEFLSSPVLKAINKNKHTLNEYATKLENFAQTVAEVVRPAYNENKDIVEDKDFKDLCKKYKVKPSQIFDIWLACYAANQNTEIEDVFAIIKLYKANESIIKDYLTKCKCTEGIFDWNNNLYSNSFYHCYNLSLLYGRKPRTRVDGFIPLVKNLDKTRELYNSLDNYKDSLKKAQEEYKSKYDDIASEFEANITCAYNKIREDLEMFKNVYITQDTELQESIHKTYPTITDKDLGIHKTEYSILDNLLKEFNKTAIKLKRNLNSSYKNDIANVSSKKSESKKNNEEEFKIHCKKLFDVAKDLKEIAYYSVHKAYDAPYEIYEDNYIGEAIPEEAVYEYEEKYGENSFDIWLDIFDSLRPCPRGDYRDIGSDLYPGQAYVMFINRKLKFDEKETD